MKIFFLPILFAIILFVGLPIIGILSLGDCDNKILFPIPTLNLLYVEVDGYKVFPGFSYIKNHQGLWTTEMKLVFITPWDAWMRLEHKDSSKKEETTCKLHLSRSFGNASPNHLSFSTRNVAEMQPLLFTPDDISGEWLKVTYEVQVENLPINFNLVNFSDQIRATISADWWNQKLFQALQIVYAYTTENDAIEAFHTDLGGAYGVPPTDDYKKLLQNHEAQCFLLKEYRCSFTGQYKNYLVHLTSIVDEKNITFQDWQELVIIVQERLLEYAR